MPFLMVDVMHKALAKVASHSCNRGGIMQKCLMETIKREDTFFFRGQWFVLTLWRFSEPRHGRVVGTKDSFKLIDRQGLWQSYT